MAPGVVQRCETLVIALVATMAPFTTYAKGALFLYDQP